jgi:ABC-type nitrate/sulfonate/bicarbonate transport system substrate-binding protein
MKTRRFACRMKTLVCALLLAGMFVPSGTLRSQELIDIHIAGGPADDTTPAFYAIKAGLFKQAGINADIISMRSGSAIAAAVAGGSAQFKQRRVIAQPAAHARRRIDESARHRIVRSHSAQSAIGTRTSM